MIIKNDTYNGDGDDYDDDADGHENDNNDNNNHNGNYNINVVHPKVCSWFVRWSVSVQVGSAHIHQDYYTLTKGIA